MKAAVLEAVDRPIEINELSISDPGPGQVRVAVKHCGCCHSDLSVVDGAFPAQMPIVLGHEAAGIVEEVGQGVTSLVPGDHVVLTPCPPCGTCYWCVRGAPSSCVRTHELISNAFADGTTSLSRGDEVVYRGLGVGAFGENVIAHETGAVKIPKEVPLDVACVVGCAVQTGVGAVLNTARVVEGSTVLVLGLGGIGLSIVQGARLASASRIIVSDPVAERRDVAAKLGATDAIDPTQEDVTARVFEMTGVGADYTFEAAGRAELVTTGFMATRNAGTIVCVGAPPIDQAITIAPAALFVMSEKKLMGCVLGSSHSLLEIPRLISLYQAGKLDLDALITARRPLAEINEAMDDLRASRGIRTILSL